MATRTCTFTAAQATSLLSYAVAGEPRFRKHGAATTSAAEITSGGRVRCTNTSTSVASVFFDDTVLTSPDCSASLTVSNRGTVGVLGYIGVIFRADHKAATYYWAIYNFAATTPRWELYKSVAGAVTLLGSFNQTLSADTDYVLKGEAIGTAIKLYVDGVARVSATDSAIPVVAGTPGRCGMALFRNFTDTTGPQGDNFVVGGSLATYQVVCDGNSLTRGYGLATPATQSYPSQLATLLDSAYAVVNRGVDSQTTGDMASDVTTDIDALLSTSVTKNIVIAWEITNDLYFGATAAAAKAAIASYGQGRVTAGWGKVILIDCLPRSGASTPGTFNADRNTVNSGLNADIATATAYSRVYLASGGTTYASALVRPSQDTRIGDAGDESDLTYYQNDTTHLNVTGAGFIAADVANAVATVVAPVLSLPVGTSTGTTTATTGATTDTAEGTMYSVVTTSITKPTAPQVKAGQNNGGTAAAFAGSVAVTSTGAKTISATGLTDSTTYYSHVTQEDAAGNLATVVTSASFTTSSPTPTPTPTGTSAAYLNSAFGMGFGL